MYCNFIRMAHAKAILVFVIGMIGRTLCGLLPVPHCPPEQYWDVAIDLCVSCVETCKTAHGIEDLCKANCPDTWQRVYGSTVSPSTDLTVSLSTPGQTGSSLDRPFVTSLVIISAVLIAVVLVVCGYKLWKRKHGGESPGQNVEEGAREDGTKFPIQETNGLLEEELTPGAG